MYSRGENPLLRGKLYKKMMQLRENIEYRLVSFLLWGAKIMSENMLYGLFRRVFLVFFYLGKRRREITVRNLSLAFPEKNSDEISSLAKESYISLSRTTAEIVMMLSGKLEKPDSMIANADEVVEKLKRITAARKDGQGIIFLTAHFGNWELGANFMAFRGFPLLVVGRKGNNRLIEEKFTKKLREGYGNQSIGKAKAMIQMAKALKKGLSVGILIDQKAGKRNSVMVDFFGMKAETTLAVANLKRKFDPLVIPVFCAREGDGKYRIIVMEAVETVCGETEEQKCLELMTRQYNAAIEKIIMQHPSQWFWMHNRWRIVPK